MPKEKGGGFISYEEMSNLKKDICPRHKTRSDHEIKKEDFLWPIY
jgi:hypothetical protein